MEAFSFKDLKTGLNPRLQLSDCERAACEFNCHQRDGIAEFDSETTNVHRSRRCGTFDLRFGSLRTSSAARTGGVTTLVTVTITTTLAVL